MMKTATVYVDQYEVHDGETDSEYSDDFEGMDTARCTRVDAAKARGADPTPAQLAAVLAIGEWHVQT